MTGMRRFWAFGCFGFPSQRPSKHCGRFRPIHPEQECKHFSFLIFAAFPPIPFSSHPSFSLGCENFCFFLLTMKFIQVLCVLFLMHTFIYSVCVFFTFSPLTKAGLCLFFKSYAFETFAFQSVNILCALYFSEAAVSLTNVQNKVLFFSELSIKMLPSFRLGNPTKSFPTFTLK